MTQLTPKEYAKELYEFYTIGSRSLTKKFCKKAIQERMKGEEEIWNAALNPEAYVNYAQTPFYTYLQETLAELDKL